MPHITLDTETTGIDPRTDKIIEIGAVNLDTGATFHVYCNPGRLVPAEATAIHGLTNEFLADKPLFQQIAPDLLAFVEGATIVAHNAPFDMAFLSAELGILPNMIIDTLALARKKHAGSCSLDALCRRYKIDTSRRTKHSALLDAQLLAEVYVELRGRQSALGLSITEQERVVVAVGARSRPLPPRISPEELVAHAAMVAGLSGSIWATL